MLSQSFFYLKGWGSSRRFDALLHIGEVVVRRSDAEVKTRLYFCVSRHSALTPNSATLDLEDTMPKQKLAL